MKLDAGGAEIVHSSSVQAGVEVQVDRATPARGMLTASGMPIREQTIHSLGEFLDAVTPEEPDPRSGRRRDTGIYHGSSQADRPLLTSLDRLGGSDPPHTKTHLEEHVLRNFARYSRPHLPTYPENQWELLVVAQHHGVPTRLLDWSYSPLVAAHFATCSAPVSDQPCAIWRLDWQQVHRAFDLPCLALLIEDLSGLFGDQPFTPWTLMRRQTPEFACMLEPPSVDQRIVAQSAMFTLCSETSESFDTFLSRRELGDALTKFIVPRDAVSHFRDQLDLAGFDERRLFPGLEGVAAAIRRYYA